MHFDKRIVIFGIALCFGIGVNAERREFNCTNSHSSHSMFGDCCDGEEFRLGHKDQAILDVCMKTPKDDSLSLPDTYWNHYLCVVKKLLGSNDISLKSYTEMMTKNLRKDKGEKILKLAGKDAASSQGELTLDALKSLWKSYFDAEFQVCGSKFEGRNGTVKNRREEWEPSVKCSNSKLPFVIVYTDYDIPAEDKCVGDITTKVGAADLKKLNMDYVRSFCVYVAFKDVDISELWTGSLNLEKMFRVSFPEFVPDKLVDSLLEKIVTRVKKDGAEIQATQSLNEFPEKYLQVQPLTNDQMRNGEIRNIAMNLQALGYLGTIYRETLCE